VTRVDVQIEGSYAATAEFTDAVQNMGGFVRPSSLNITPRQLEGRNVVSARLTCEVLQFPLADSLLSLEGGARDDS
jgi:hypothetical protein